ncbi:MAG: ABC transporter ATP-binding protein [Prochloraceae cyanobacterium]|nr:ABC transporter ATP-binding protein [Prochloraceae cyanobacterium]
MSVSPATPKLKRQSSNNDWRLLLQLLPYARRNQNLLYISLILLIPLSIAGAVQPLIVGQAISLIREEPVWSFLADFSRSEGLNLLIGLLIVTIAVRLVFVSIQGFLVQKLGQQITAGLREDLFIHLTSLSTKFFDRTPVGKLVTRLTNDVEALGDVFATGAIGIVSDFIYVLVMLIAVFMQQWQLALMLLSMLIPVTILVIYFQQQYRKANYRAREELSKLNSMLQENVVGINIVQLFRRERYNSELFRSLNDRYRLAIDKTIFHDSAVSATLEWISLVAIAGVLWLGSIFILNETIAIGTFTTFILYAQRLFNPVQQLANKFTVFQGGFTAIERIDELMSEPIEVSDPQSESRQRLARNSKQLNKNSDLPAKGEICFENVWFAYKENEYVLKGLDFKIKAGEKVALVGPTGAGKSSIIRLLCRLYDPSKGKITIDGIDIKDIPQADLRRYIGVILQESFLFAGDLKRNITLGENYSTEEIENSAKLTNIDRFIEQLPQGYDTQLRERGTNLSGGQKQLIAFARVAIRNPQILVLDEATANLDVATEALIQEALDRILANRTAIIIAHRLSTIRNVDRILVLKKGELIESGTHEELLAIDGLYAGLYKLQMLNN